MLLYAANVFISTPRSRKTLNEAQPFSNSTNLSVVLVVSLQPTHQHQTRNPTYRSISPRVPNSNLYNTTPAKKASFERSKMTSSAPLGSQTGNQKGQNTHRTYDTRAERWRVTCLEALGLELRGFGSRGSRVSC